MFLNSLMTKRLVPWGIIVCLLVSACGESSARSTDSGMQKYRDLSEVETAFVKGIVYRDNDRLFMVTSKPAFEELNGWFANHPAIECHGKDDFRMAISGGPTIDEIRASSLAVRDKVRVQITCNERVQDSARISLYKLEVYDLEFIYTSNGWEIQGWRSIQEGKGF